MVKTNTYPCLYDVYGFLIIACHITSQMHVPSPSIPLVQFPWPLHSPVAPFRPGQAMKIKIAMRWSRETIIEELAYRRRYLLAQSKN